MKTLQEYLKDQNNIRVSESLKSYERINDDPILKIVPRKWFDADDRICLHFSNISALLMYEFELEDEIVDGKYNNARPDDHWEWTKKTIFTVDGNEFYTGSSPYRIPGKKYNVDGLVRTVKQMLNGQANDRDFTLESAIYLYNYGKMGKCLTMDELKKVIEVIPWGTLYETLRISNYMSIIAETFGWVLRKNPDCTYEEMKNGLQRYQRDALAELPQFDNEEFFERFKNTEYTFSDFKADYDSMIKTVNTPKYE